MEARVWFCVSNEGEGTLPSLNSVKSKLQGFRKKGGGLFEVSDEDNENLFRFLWGQIFQIAPAEG